MQREFYTSCIKINGVPLLPPLMTDNIKQEMNHYKQLAIDVEKTLKARQIVKRAIKNRCIQALIEPIDELRNTKYSSDSDISNGNTTSDINNSDSGMTIVEHVLTMRNAAETKDECIIQSLTWDTLHSQSQVCLTSNIVNDLKALNASIDQNKCINEAVSLNSNEDVMSLESWKPEVPRTLDVVPITLEEPKSAYDTRISEMTNESENPPKLLRQGSYVLDAPSPMLLAHMHTELIERDYIPSSTVTVSQPKQWSIIQPKIEWESKQFVAGDCNASVKSGHTSEAVAIDSNHAIEAVSRHTMSDILTEPYQSNTPISSTQAVDTNKDYIRKPDIAPIKQDRIIDSDFNGEDLLEKLEKNNSSWASSLTNEPQESTANVNNHEMQLLGKDGDHCKTEDVKRSKDSIIRAKPSINPSEKLLTVYKEIEEMHKKQIMELINRQQKEQSLLQEEFQKQQMLLLTEIQKYSSKVPYKIDVPNVMSDQLVLNDEGKLEDTVCDTDQQLNVDSPSKVVHCNNELLSVNHANIVACPLDSISPKDLSLLEHNKAAPFNTKDTLPAALNSDFTRKLNFCGAICNNNNDNNNNDNDHASHDVVYKNPTVHRRLLPLDSNTTHLPVLDTSIYLDKHVSAVNIINAYARGYLTRRLMRTERVIMLKKIYKEALQCMLKLHVDAPLNLAEVNFLHRLQLQCDAASMNLVELFAQCPEKKMKTIAQDREIKRSRIERPASTRSYSFATQQTLARRNVKEFEPTVTKYQRPLVPKRNITRSRCQTWTSDIREKLVSPITLHQSIKRSTSAGTVRKPWR